MGGDVSTAPESEGAFVVVAEFEVKPDKMEAFLAAALDRAQHLSARCASQGAGTSEGGGRGTLAECAPQRR